jgi:hypothetical protein
MAVAHQEIGFGTGTSGPMLIDHVEPSWNSRKRELTFMTASRVEKFNLEVSIQTFVTINKPAFFRAKPAVKILNEILSEVDSIVNTIELGTEAIVASKKSVDSI